VQDQNQNKHQHPTDLYWTSDKESYKHNLCRGITCQSHRIIILLTYLGYFLKLFPVVLGTRKKARASTPA